MTCPYCERPLECASCRREHTPDGRAQYEALSRTEVPIDCAGCGSVLVCHWCRTPFDGRGDEPDESD